LILVDTNIYVAYLNNRDQNHEIAKKLAERLLLGEFGSRFTISEVFSEAATVLFNKTKSMDIVNRVWKIIYSEDNAWGQVIIITKDDIDRSWEIYKKYTTKKRPLSFVDCLLIASAQYLGIDAILSFDEEFDGILKRIFE
jgi:predicted nucleic acid-binding protein